MRPITAAIVCATLGYTGVLLGFRTRTHDMKRYPETRRDDLVETIHGTRVADPYRWLEDAAAPEVQSWMASEDELTRSALAELPGRDALVARLRALFYYDALGAPVHHGTRSFWARKRADQEKNTVYWRDDGASEEHVLLDPNQWSEDGSTALGGWWPSWDGKVVAYNVNPNNADEAEMHFLDVATGKELGDVITGTKYSGASWTPDSRGFYYTWVPPIGGEVTIPNRPGFAELRFHLLGADPAHDPVIREATGDAETFMGGGITKDGHWLLVAIQHGWNSSDWYLQDLRAGTGWQPLVVGKGANFTITEWQDRFYALTDLDAPRYRIVRITDGTWETIVPEDPDATLDGMNIVGGKLVVTWLRRATSAMEIRDLDGALVRAVALPPMGTTGGISGEPDDDTGYFAFTSFTEPQVIYETSIATGEVKEWSRVSLPIDTSRFVTEQVTYTSKDGTPITMFLIHRRDVIANGTNPTVLYGYGGFSVNMTPGFASSRMVWLEDGGVWAIPNLRGGGEYGEDWHKAGMLGNKQNVFDDYLAAARWLIDHRWTSPAHLAIYGGSNGGLLVGAAMTQAPELFRAVVCGVPLLDMIRFHQFGSGATWIPEYGDPSEKAAFDWLYAYSPYHHVQEGVRYPALLMLSADSDDRVDPMHARKFVAAVQHADPDGAPAYLRIEAHGGHGGADLVKQQVEQYADMYAFLRSQLR